MSRHRGTRNARYDCSCQNDLRCCVHHVPPCLTVLMPGRTACRSAQRLIVRLLSRSLYCGHRAIRHSHAMGHRYRPRPRGYSRAARVALRGAANELASTAAIARAIIIEHRFKVLLLIVRSARSPDANAIAVAIVGTAISSKRTMRYCTERQRDWTKRQRDDLSGTLEPSPGTWAHERRDEAAIGRWIAVPPDRLGDALSSSCVAGCSHRFRATQAGSPHGAAGTPSTRRAGGSAVTSRVPMVIVPVLAVSRPAISRNVVDLPQPDGPSSFCCTRELRPALRLNAGPFSAPPPKSVQIDAPSL